MEPAVRRAALVVPRVGLHSKVVRGLTVVRGRKEIPVVTATSHARKMERRALSLHGASATFPERKT